MKEAWTIKKTIDWGTGYFQKNGIENPRLNMEHLLAEILKKKRIDLYVQFERELNAEELAKLKESIQRRVKKEPLQYILGSVDFCDLKISVGEGVLIPRPETELLAEKVKEQIQLHYLEQTKIKILDLGTGSGCLGLALTQPFLQAELTAVDISEQALVIAAKNGEQNNLNERVSFLCGSWFSVFDGKEREPFDVIVSNPPYVTEEEFETLQAEVKDFEPRGALVSGPTGLEMYDEIIPKGSLFLKKQGLLAFEAGKNQAPYIKELMEKNNFQSVQVIKDLNGIERFIIGFNNG